MTRTELETWNAALLEAWRFAATDALRAAGSLLTSRLRPAAVSKERLRDAVNSLDKHAPQVIDRLEPVLRYHAALAGEPDPPAAAQRAAEQLVADYIQESRRQLRPLLDGAWPGHPAGTAALERIIERWPARGERIAAGLARALQRETA